VPIGVLALGCVTVALDVPARRGDARVDYPGAALLAAAVGCVLLLTQDGWGAAEIVLLGAGGAGLLGAWIARERRANDPILPLRLFRLPVFTVVSAALFLTTLAFFAVVVFLPVFFQVVTGASATRSGLLLLPLLLAGIATTFASGRAVARSGRYKAFPIAGLALMTVGLLLLAQMDAGTSQLVAALLPVVFGAGFGMVSPVLTIALQNAVDRRDLGIATASANLVRALGGALGVAVFGALLADRGLDPQAAASALHTVFLVAAPFAAAGMLVTLLLQELPLRGGAPAGARA
jgi:Na+/melibiose symporter-like transporter